MQSVMTLANTFCWERSLKHSFHKTVQAFVKKRILEHRKTRIFRVMFDNIRKIFGVFSEVFVKILGVSSVPIDHFK